MRIRQGIDIVQVERIRQSIEKHERLFLDKIFTPSEQAYCESQRRKYEHYAARFAAKEAVVKALRASGKRSWTLREIEIIREGTGKPAVKLSSQVRRRLGLSGKARIEISLSHERECAVAAAVLWDPLAR